MILPVILYGCETRTVGKSDENKFLIIETKIIKNIFVKNNIKYFCEK